MNAGAWGASIGELTEQVGVCLPGERRLIEAESLNFSYRHLELPTGAVVSRVVLALSAGETGAIRSAMADYRRRREDAQPLGEHSCGSVFRNPPGARTAGELLDLAGCKGLEHGGAAVSATHANFIINRGGARAADVIALMDECRRRVLEKFGVTLEPEVILLGDINLRQV
jgi:UDP-N-acetylmuramate dehydrogenase